MEEFDGCANEVIELVKEFVLDAERQIRIMTEAAAKGRLKVIIKEAHSIKGGAANLNAAPLSSAAKKIEDISLRGDADEIPKAISDLVIQKEKMVTWFQKVSRS